MPGEEIRLGPFVGGINSASDPSAVADAELVDLVNMELDIDGSLISRPPIQEIINHSGWSERIVALGVGVFATGNFLIGSNVNGVYHFNSGVWTLITNTFQATCMVQYDDFAYLVAKPGSANPGGKWSPSGGFVAIAAMPKGEAALIHKERMFVVPGASATSNTSRVTFSNPAAVETWSPSDFIDISKGDGQKLVDLVVYNNNLVLFKQDSTYLLSYAVKPVDAELVNISKTIGATQRRCVTVYENSIFVYHEGDVFELVNYDFAKINVKVPFIFDSTAPGTRVEDVFICIFGDRLLVRYFNRIYIYGLRTRTWSRWESASADLHNIGPLVALPSNVIANTNDIYYAGSSIQSNLRFYQINDGFDSATSESSLRINHVKNPGFEVDTASWNAGGTVPPALARSLTTPDTGVADGLITWGADFGNINTLLEDLEVGVQYTVFCRANVASRHLKLKITGGPTGLPTTITGAYQTISVTFIATSSTHTLEVVPDTQPAAGNIGRVDTFICSQSATFDYFDGSSANCAWLGTAHNSRSISFTRKNTRLIICTMRTKNYDLAISHRYKKLFWWGCDFISNNNITGVARPIIINFNVTWNDLHAYTWDQLAAGGWDSPLSAPADIVTTVGTSAGIARRFAKFMKTLRFRQIGFEVKLTTIGATTDGPAKILTLTAMILSRAKVSKGIN